MSRQTQWVALVLSLLCAIGIFAAAAKADVTGEFVTHISLNPQSTVSEISVINFDIENELTAEALISGLTTTFHTHFGIAGMEDIIIQLTTTLGALDLRAMIVFGRFAFGATRPFYPTLHFIMKKVDASVEIGGVRFSTTAQIEDTAAFTSQSTAYAFGDVLRLSGETPSGVNISSELGLCMQQVPSNIKKHPNLSPYSVNPHCATTPKPDVLFDFETILVSGVPLAPNVVGTGFVSCITIGPCLLTTSILISGGFVPFSTVVSFSDILSLTLGNLVLTFFEGPGTLSIILLPNGTIGSINLTLDATLNADTNPASFSLSSVIVPGAGLTNATAQISIQRSALSVTATAVFGGGPPAVLQSVSFDFRAAIGIIVFETDAIFGPSGLITAIIQLTINF
ncbi:hypothetical protein HY229_01800 [Candidatus Acetothermia bacterium]|nr:hypothetical protein [Candidatus Acetothermia bacterium]MBI3642824.1 hypothetical protein [Candidatus Acetothermia bacterium]